MQSELRKTGMDVVGDVAWGTHFCLFYETPADLLETQASYCKNGLENDEFCFWVVAQPLSEDDVTHFVRVRTGLASETMIEVFGDLKEGDTVVSGPYKALRELKPGAKVKREMAGAKPVK